MQKDQQKHLKLAILGNVDSGKSTLVGVLTKGTFDDGRGSARLKVFNYAHEAETGRTSSIGHEVMGFDEKGAQIVPDRFNPNKNKYWKEIVERSHKVVSIFDLCGHEKYLKTTIHGLTGLIPDYALLIVGSNMGISKMTKEHLGIVHFLKIPFIVILTKIDICPENIYDDTVKSIVAIARSSIINKLPAVISKKTPFDELDKYAELMPADKLVPIFSLSSVTGEGVEQLVYFISRIGNRDSISRMIGRPDAPLEFSINEVFLVTGVGIVASGILKAGTAVLNKHLYLGPDRIQGFKVVVIKSIHVSRIQRDHAVAGQYCCFGLKPAKATEKLTRSEFRKGMVLLESDYKPVCAFEFEAEVHVLHHATTIETGYEAVVHCGVIRQSAHLKSILETELLRNDDKGLVRFRFMYSPEYVREGDIFLLREGRTKVLGTITRVIPEDALTEEDRNYNAKLQTRKRLHKPELKKEEEKKE